MKKSLIAILMAVIMLLSMIPLLSAQALEPAANQTTVNGVLASDYYILYPFSAKSVNIGFSKYGELIGIAPGLDQSNQTLWTGLEYDSGARDPFCPASVIPMTSWINGWYIDIQYTDPALSGTKKDRHLWAFAMFGDGFGFGGDWNNTAVNPGDNPGYGRQTNGVARSDPLLVLYNGPREYIAQATTHIFDKSGSVQWPVVDVSITVVFDKVSKQVILYKDIKLKIPKLHLVGRLNVQFSNREEYDLGPATTYDSYVHYYEQAGLTCYGPDWSMAQDLLRDNVTFLVGDGHTLVFTIPTTYLAEEFMKIWINGVFVDPSMYTVDYTAKKITFLTPPPVGATIEIHYKFLFKTAEPIAQSPDGPAVPSWKNEYDYAQVISSDLKYVAWDGLWPPCSDFTVDGILRYLSPLVMVNEPDLVYESEPFQSPLIIGEWDFLMDHTVIPQFRCVEVKGITDRHDGDDMDIAFGHSNILDREAKYQLDSVFKPFGLSDAVKKQTTQWVEWTYGPTYKTKQSPVVVQPTDGYVPVSGGYTTATAWDQYGVFSERVIDLTTGKLLNRYLGQYSVVLNSDGTMSISGLSASHYYKILYSTHIVPKFVVLIGDSYGHSAPSGQSIFGYSTGGDPGRDGTMFTSDDLDFAKVINSLDANTVTVLSVDYSYLYYPVWQSFQYISAKTGGQHYNAAAAWDANITDYIIKKMAVTGAADVAFVIDMTGSMSTNIADVTTKTKAIMTNLVGYNVRFGLATFKDYNSTYTSYGYGPAVYGTTPDYPWNMTVDLMLPQWWANVTNAINNLGTPSGGNDGPEAYSRALYESQFFDWVNTKGQYEWITVGNNSLPIDSAGASLVSEAFNSYKGVDIGIAGMDMFSSTPASQSPMIMAKFAPYTEARPYYMDSIGRAALTDDWCTKWPVASSNIIGVGGPFANLFAYYANDFTSSFYGLFSDVGTPYNGMITAIPCWNRGWNGTWNVYTTASDSSISYAVVSTTMDINGTVGFMVWGAQGRDTFYVSQWLHGDLARGLTPGIIELENAPCGLTSIILQINYADPKHPTFAVVECPGTVSETAWNYLWIYPGADVTNLPKGGIHDP
jgi:hypothetical protein